MAFRRKKETRHSPIRNMLENNVCFHYTFVATIFVQMNAQTKLITIPSVFDPLLFVKTLKNPKVAHINASEISIVQLPVFSAISAPKLNALVAFMSTIYICSLKRCENRNFSDVDASKIDMMLSIPCKHS